MKISKSGGAGPSPLAEQEAGVRTEKVESRFAAELSRAQDAQSQEHLDRLLDKITEQGRRLAEVPTYGELKVYRDLVSSFLKEAVGRMYTLKSQAGWDHHGRRRIYSIIKEVDKQLAGLAEDIRLGQERGLNILARVDAIRGLLVDIKT